MTEKGEKVPNTPDETPEFTTFEGLQEWLDSQIESTGEKSNLSGKSAAQKKVSGSSVKKKQSSSKKKKPAKPDEAYLLAEGVGDITKSYDPNTWSTVHFYTRAGDSVAKTRIDAKEENKFRNENVLVFYHDHCFGEACTKICAQV